MLDKIIVLKSKKQAFLIFTNRQPISVSSSVDIVPLLLWYLDSPHAHLTLDNNGMVVGIELRRDCSDEITVEIEIKGVA